ncbi:MAG: 1-acyl-sn-glycerol-3-phosphate acyltransferase [Candidatus Omnitrophica bacterium]|nr:1-acyl-sn-glycerol-3-phosphate acyltransferase [Candidatus Omnitrophota bacterium]
MWYFIGWVFFLIFFKAYLNLKVIGRENIPKKGAFIFASNHSSYLDPIILGVSVYRSLNYMAQEDLFTRPFLGWALRKVHSFPVRREENDFRAVRQALNKLSEGKPLVIFPEGMRSKDGSLKRAKPGIGFIAAKAKVPVVPAYIKGAFDALPKGVSTLRRRPVTIHIGKPISVDNAHSGTKDKDAYQKISDAIMHRITELS